jgi:hypothetical protein
VVRALSTLVRGIGLGLVAGLLLAACYDSRWGEAKRAQQHAAAASKPADIAPADDERMADAGRRTLRIRMRPSERYLAQTVDAPKQIADLVEDANRVLGPTLALALVVDRVQPWTSDVDTPDAALTALRTEDPGQDVDVVVGMIGALPRQTDSLHELGIATLLGKHVVVRAASRFDEHDAIDRGFSELSDDDRARIAKERKRHRALAVFLHELGHSLGAVHEVDPRSLMHPSYDPKMNGFGGIGIALMRVALDSDDRLVVARGQLALLRGVASSEWVTADRDQEAASLEATLAAAPGPARGRVADPGSQRASDPATDPGAAAAVATGPQAPFELKGPDGKRYLDASALFQAGAVAAAYGTAKPLFARYPDVSAVQELRCQMATVRWLERDALRAECAPSLRLSGASATALDGG